MKIAIASGKGGTGKTTLSTNLASYIAETRECVLADLDVEEPNSGLFIRGELVHQEEKFKRIPEWNRETCTLCGQCQEVCNFNAILKMGPMLDAEGRIMVFPSLCHGCYACSELCPTQSLPMKPAKMGDLKVFKRKNLSFIESRLIIGEEHSSPLIKQTIDYVDEHYDSNVVKLFDSPPGTACPVIEAIRGTDLVILVTEPTPFGLHDLKLAVETVRQMEKPFVVVINRDGIGNDGVEQYCKAEGILVIARIPNDRKIAETYSKGLLLYKEITSVREAVEAISKYIFEHMRGEA